MKNIILLLLPLILSSTAFFNIPEKEVVYHTDSIIFMSDRIAEHEAREKEKLSIFPPEYREIVRACHTAYPKIDIHIIYAIIETESNWNNGAINHNYNGSIDKGLVQINSTYLSYYQDKFISGLDPFDPADSIEFCFAYVNWLYGLTDDINEAIMAYNIGIGSVRRGTRQEAGNQYLSKIMNNIKNIKNN